MDKLSDLRMYLVTAATTAIRVLLSTIIIIWLFKMETRDAVVISVFVDYILRTSELRTIDHHNRRIINMQTKTLATTVGNVTSIIGIIKRRFGDDVPQNEAN